VFLESLSYSPPLFYFFLFREERRRYEEKVEGVGEDGRSWAFYGVNLDTVIPACLKLWKRGEFGGLLEYCIVSTVSCIVRTWSSSGSLDSNYMLCGRRYSTLVFDRK
jgi:hypothetical protein